MTIVANLHKYLPLYVLHPFWLQQQPFEQVMCIVIMLGGKTISIRYVRQLHSDNFVLPATDFLCTNCTDSHCNSIISSCLIEISIALVDLLHRQQLHESQKITGLRYVNFLQLHSCSMC